MCLTVNTGYGIFVIQSTQCKQIAVLDRKLIKRWAFLLPAESQFAEHALSKRLVVLGNSH